jgi:hypothetical protein
MKLRGVLWAVFGAVVVGCISVFTWVRHSAGRETSGAAAPNAAATVDVTPAEMSRIEAEPFVFAESPQRRTVRDYLADYYGAQWESVRDQFERDRKALLDRPLEEPSPIATWEESEADAGSRIILTPERCEAYAKSEVDLDPTAYESWERVRRQFSDVPENVGQRELDALRDIVKPFEERVVALGVQRAAIIADIQTMKWQLGKFSKAPFALPEQPLDAGRRCVFTTAGHSNSGWAVQLNIYEDELPPEYFQYWNDIKKEKAQSLKAAMEYIATL